MEQKTEEAIRDINRKLTALADATDPKRYQISLTVKILMSIGPAIGAFVSAYIAIQIAIVQLKAEDVLLHNQINNNSQRIEKVDTKVDTHVMGHYVETQRELEREKTRGKPQ